MYTDSELKDKVLDNNQDAILCLYAEYKKRVYRKAFQYLRSEDEAEDFTCEFFMYLIYEDKGIKSFDLEKYALSACINVMLKRKLIDKWRQKKREDEMRADFSTFDFSDQEKEITSAVDDIASPDTPYEEIESKERVEIVRNIVSKLHPKCQKIIQLIYDSEFSHTKIAESLGIPKGTARCDIYRCTQKLKKLLHEEFSKMGYEPF